jgi:hypothetical protein
MTPMRVLVTRLMALFVRRRRDAELSEEIQAHLDRTPRTQDDRRRDRRACIANGFPGVLRTLR